MDTKTRKEIERNVTFQMLAKNILDARQEIDELAVQLALGKAEAKDKFEEIKHEFRVKVGELKSLIEQAPEALPPDVRRKIEELELQLSLGKTESKEKFAIQKKRILAAINHVENELRMGMSKIQSLHYFAHEAEKFRLKLEIIRLRFGIRKFEVKDEFRENMARAKTEISKMSKKVRSTLNHGKEQYADFSDEVALVYRHIKKAVKGL